MSLKAQVLFTAFVVLILSSPGFGASNSVLEAGVNAFQQGKYDEARQKFSELLKEPSWEFAALYNLGNTAVRQKHLGEALAFYTLALKENPHDRDTQDNIKYVYSELGGHRLTAAPSNYQLFRENVLDKFTFSEALGATLLLSIVLLIFVNSFIKSRSQVIAESTVDESDPSRKGPPLRLISSFISFIIFMSFSILKLVDTYDGRGIVIVNNIGLRSGPSETNASMMDIPEGSEVIIHDIDHDWVQVSAPGGSLLGWIPQGSLIATSGEGPEF